MLRTDGFRALDRQECLRLPVKLPVGRLVCTRQALSTVLPVNFRLDAGASVLMRTSPVSALVRAVDSVVVASNSLVLPGRVGCCIVTGC